VKLALHSYWRSSSAWRVRIALHHKQLPFEYRAVHLVQDEQKAPAFRDANPMEQVPLLEVEHDGAVHRVTQSLAIVQLLEQLSPARPLLPADPFRRAHALELAEIVNAGIQPLQNLAVTRRLESLGQDGRAWARAFIEKGLAALEQHGRRLAGRHFVGDEPSLADAYLVPQLYNARRFDVDLAPFPTLLRVEAAAAELPSFQAAHPDRQPDAPAGDKR
jgi:maleylpyruvate isomerase